MPTVLHIDGEAMTYEEEVALEELEAQERQAEEEAERAEADFCLNLEIEDGER